MPRGPGEREKGLLVESVPRRMRVGVPVAAEVRLPRVFGSHMVLQRERPLCFWGWGDANETITVTLGEESKQAKANERGEWKVTLPARKGSAGSS